MSSLSFRSIAWNPIRKLLKLGEMIVDLKGTVFLALQLSWSLKEKPGRFQEGKKDQSGVCTGPWTLLGGKKLLFDKKKKTDKI